MTTTVTRTRTISAPADVVWRIVRDFGRLDEWVPAVPSPLELTGDPFEPGTERIFRNDGAVFFVERFNGNDEDARTHSYSVTTAPFTIDGHRATITVREAGEHSVVEWNAQFVTDEGAGAAIAEGMAQGTFEPGLAELARIATEA